MYNFFKSNELSEAQNYYFYGLLSRFPLYLRKKSAGCRYNRGYQKKILYLRTREQWCAGITLKNRQAPNKFSYSFASYRLYEELKNIQ